MTSHLSPQRISPLRACGLGLALAAVVLTGCSKTEDGKTVGQKLDTAVAKTEQAASQAMASTSEAVVKAEDRVASAAEKAQASGEKNAAAIGNTIEDAAITASIAAGLAKDPDLSAIKIDIDTKGGAVSLYGPATTVAAKARATTIAQGVKGVTAVKNELTVKN
jgi:hyperosmotically inducible periplasmic protein